MTKVNDYRVNVTDSILDALDGESAPQFRAVKHPADTAYASIKTLCVHPDNPRNHVETVFGIPVPSSVNASAMADSILRIGDITTPLTVCGDGCASTKGTVLQGNRRLEGALQLYNAGKLPQTLTERGIPVRYVDGLTQSQEIDLINDHGGTIPLNPTESFLGMLALQAQGMRPEDIVFRHPGLLAGYQKKTLEPLPADEKGRAEWYAKRRDTLAYNVLCWGLFPAALLPARILLIQDEKEGAFAGQAKPVYTPFKPTAKRGKLLYAAMRADKKARQWSKDGGPEFAKLVAQFTTEDTPTAPTAPTAPTENNAPALEPLPTKEVQRLRDTAGNSVPVLGALIDYIETGTKPDGFHDAVKRSAFSVALVDNMLGVNRDIWAGFIPAPVFAAITSNNVNGVQTAIEQLATAPAESTPKTKRGK